MANVLCVIELHEGKALPVCLEALGQARRLSTRLGATLYAVVPMARAPSYGEDDLIAQLARHGADKVVLVTDEALGGVSDSLRWGTHGPSISMSSDLLPPSIMLFGATPGGREVAPRAAARMGAAFLADAWLEVHEDRLQAWEGAGAAAHGFEGEIEFPIVATVPPGRYATARGDEEAEVEVLASSGRPPDFDELGWESDPHGRPLVLAAPNQTEGARPLAQALGGEVTASGRAGELRQVAISLGPSLEPVRAPVKVALGTAEGAHYRVAGEAVALAAELARVVETEGE
jgi:electron transfer flavoprotein alpha subunit